MSHPLCGYKTFIFILYTKYLKSIHNEEVIPNHPSLCFFSKINEWVSIKFGIWGSISEYIALIGRMIGRKLIVKVTE